MKNYITLILCACFISAFSAKPKHQYVKIKTELGECIIQLYNETPQHRDNFIKLTEKGTFNGTLFHRVIKDFMIQSGDFVNVCFVVIDGHMSCVMLCLII